MFSPIAVFASMIVLLVISLGVGWLVNDITQPSNRRRKTMGLFGKLFGVKVDRIKDAILKSDVLGNPNDISEAQLREYQEKWEEITTRLGTATQRLAKEQRDVTELEEAIRIHVIGAKKMQEKRDAAGTEEEKNRFQVKIDQMVGDIKSMQAKMDIEKAEATTASSHVNLLQEAADKCMERIKSHRKAIQDAKDNLESAKLKRDMAKDREEDAKLVSGLVDPNAIGINSALDAINKVAQDLEQEATIANQRADMLQSDVAKDSPDADIRQVLEEAKSTTPKGTPESTDDFLSKFK